MSIALWLFWGGEQSGLPEGSEAPALSVPWTGEGESFELASRRGHVTVLAFWATWCPACRAEGPTLSRVQRRIEAHGDMVVGLSIDHAPLASIAGAARRLGMTYPIALGTQAEVQRFAVELLPTIIVVGPDGRVARTFAGTVGEEALLEAVADAR